MSETLYYRFVVKRDSAANFAAKNTLLLEGEYGLEIDTRRTKLGDGVTAWNSLPYRSAVTLADVRRILDLLGAAEGDIIYKGPSGWTTLPKGPNGNVLTLGSGLPTWAPGGGGGAMSHIATVTVSGSAVSSISFTGLDLAADGAYLIIAGFKNATTSAASLSVFFNADTTATNYWKQTLLGNGSGTNSIRSNNAGVVEMDNSNSTLGRILISRDPDGRPLTVSESCRNPGSSIYSQINAHFRNNTANVTELAITSSVAGAIAIGSYARLYKVAA